MNLFQQLEHDRLQQATRRHFLQTCATGMGSMFLASAAGRAFGAHGPLDINRPSAEPLKTLSPQFPGKAKRVIFLHMAGAPSQHELFDYKPELAKLDGQDCPQEYLEGKRFAFITGVPKLLGPQFKFAQHGESGAWVSDRLPHFQSVVDDVCFVKSMKTDQFNHAPAQLLFHTGQPRVGNPSLGSWVVYGLGTENQNLPGYMVLVSGGKVPSAGKSVWGSGFLPSVYQGVQCRSKGDPILYLSNPDGVSRDMRRRALDSLNKLNQQNYEEVGDPETMTRISQYEMAFRMQMSASDVMDLSQEPKHIHEMYGTQPGKESFANNCLLARRLAENGVRFIQLFHWGWDSHGTGADTSLNQGFSDRCNDVDKPMTALLKDLKQRGMLDDTLVVWGGEFGRTPMRENRGGKEMSFVGRDHNPGCFTTWMAGGGVNAGTTYGESDPIGYEVAKNPVEIRDFHATMLHQLGFDHKRFSYPVQGLDQKLTGVKPAKVVKGIIS